MSTRRRGLLAAVVVVAALGVALEVATQVHGAAVAQARVQATQTAEARPTQTALAHARATAVAAAQTRTAATAEAQARATATAAPVATARARVAATAQARQTAAAVVGPDYDGKSTWDGWHWMIRVSTAPDHLSAGETRPAEPFEGSLLLTGSDGSVMQQPIAGSAFDTHPFTSTAWGCSISLTIQKDTMDESADGKLLHLQVLGGGHVYGDVQTHQAYGVLSLVEQSPNCQPT